MRLALVPLALALAPALALPAAAPGLAQSLAQSLTHPAPQEATETAQEAPEETALSEMTEIELIETLLNEDGWTEAMFAPSFLAELPLADIRDIVDSMRQTMGTPVTVTGSGETYVARSQSHSMAVTLVRDGEGRLSGLFFAAPDETGRTIDALLSELEALAPESAYLVTRDDAVLHAQDADMPLAVGSAFKLGVLKALQDAIEDGDLGWNDVYLLDARHKSLPSGILQAFPQDSPLTVSTLAALMISQSDNTATDFLMGIVGRDAVGDALGITAPLTTRELFVLKADAALREDYLALDEDDEEARDAVFDAIAEAPLPTATQISTPHTQGVEWYVSLETLCGLAANVALNDVFAINPGPIGAGAWQSVAYKGGSEIGVLNLTTHLVAPSGETYCLAVTLNANEALDQNAAIGIYGAIAARLAGALPE